MENYDYDLRSVQEVRNLARMGKAAADQIADYTEEQIDKILELNSDAQAYKQAGNGVTVNVIEAIGRRLFQVHSGIHVLQ